MKKRVFSEKPQYEREEMVKCKEFVEVLGEYIGEEYYRVFRMGKNDKEVTNKQFVEQIKKEIKNFEQLILFLDRNITVFAAEKIETYRDIFCTCNNFGKKKKCKHVYMVLYDIDKLEVVSLPLDNKRKPGRPNTPTNKCEAAYWKSRN